MASSPVQMMPLPSTNIYNMASYEAAAPNGDQERVVLSLLRRESGLHERELHRHSSSSSSSSSSSWSSSDEDFFQLDANEFSEPAPAAADQDGTINGLLSSSPPQVGSAAEILASALGLRDTRAPVLPSDASSGSWSKTPPPVGADRSPPAQVMVRSDVPDPYRIPSSVFESSSSSKPTAPTEWSVASNESLFSIHMGNTSSSSSNIVEKSGDVPYVSSSPPDLGSAAVETTTEAANVEAMKAVLRAAADEHDANHKDHRPPPAGDTLLHSESTSHRSDCSKTSADSFAFPILTSAGLPRIGSAKVEPAAHDHLQQQGHKQQMETKEEEMHKPVMSPDAGRRAWCPCFPCTFHWL